jgi:hypothetical protein
VLVAAADAFGLIQLGALGRIETEEDSDHSIVVAAGKCVALPGLVCAALMEAKRVTRQGSNAERFAARHALAQPSGRHVGPVGKIDDWLRSAQWRIVRSGTVMMLCSSDFSPSRVNYQW